MSQSKIVKVNDYELIHRIVTYFFNKYHIFSLKRLGILFDMLERYNLKRASDKKVALEILFNIFHNFIKFPFRIINYRDVKRIFLRVLRQKMYMILIIRKKNTKKFFLKKIDLTRLGWFR